MTVDTGQTKQMERVIINFDELQQNKNKKEDFFLLIYKSGYRLDILGCNNMAEIKEWASFFGKTEFIRHSDKKLILKCNMLDPYDLPYEVESFKYVWVFVKDINMYKYANIKSASEAVEKFIEEGIDNKNITIDDISVVAGIAIDTQNITIYF